MKQFLVILGLTALVWLGVSMSVEREYPMQVGVRIEGYDHTRYAVLQQDTVLNAIVTLTGYDAFYNHYLRRPPQISISLTEERRAVAVKDIAEDVRHAITGARRVSSYKDSLRITLSERSVRRYKPRLDRVAISFADQYGLYGEPQITPAEVELYGAQEVLDQIPDLYVAATQLRDIRQNGTYTLNLEPLWLEHEDLFASATEVNLYLPVEPYVEHQYRVPLRIADADSSVSIRLYPDEAIVHVWIAQRDLGREPVFDLSVSYLDALRGNEAVAVRLGEFPAYLRLRSIEPQEVQCVIIQ